MALLLGKFLRFLFDGAKTSRINTIPRIIFLYPPKIILRRRARFICKHGVHARRGIRKILAVTRFPGKHPSGRVRIIDLCGDASVVDKSPCLKCRCESSSVRRAKRLRDRFRATCVMRAIYSLQPGPDSSWTRRDATARSPMSSYSNRIFQEQFSITTTVLTKPFPSCKMHEDGFFFFFFSARQPFAATEA